MCIADLLSLKMDRGLERDIQLLVKTDTTLVGFTVDHENISKHKVHTIIDDDVDLDGILMEHEFLSELLPDSMSNGEKLSNLTRASIRYGPHLSYMVIRESLRDIKNEDIKEEVTKLVRSMEALARRPATRSSDSFSNGIGNLEQLKDPFQLSTITSESPDSYLDLNPSSQKLQSQLGSLLPTELPSPMIKLSLLASQTQPRSPRSSRSPSPTRSVSPKGSLSPSISQSPSGSLSGSLQQPLPASSIESLNLGGVYTSTRLSGDSVESPRSYVYPEEYPDVTCNLSNSAIVNKDATGGLKGSNPHFDMLLLTHSNNECTYTSTYISGDDDSNKSYPYSPGAQNIENP